MTRKISYRTNGHTLGSTTRLMSPTDLGEQLKPFIFLDRFNTNFNKRPSDPLYPHSGIGVLTLFTDGDVVYDDPNGTQGTLDSGAVEYNHTGKGVWLGQELSAGKSPSAQGFQLWLALPPEQEHSKAFTQFINSQETGQTGPAKVICGEYEGTTGKVNSQMDLNFLMIKLDANESWTYQTPKTHNVLWLSVMNGSLQGDYEIEQNELVSFENNNESVTLTAGNEPVVLVMGSAKKHPYHLHFGRHSVHTNQSALFKAEKHIALLKEAMAVPYYRPEAPMAMPVFHGFS